VELVKNKVSGKNFVVLDDTGGADFLVVTPEGKVKRLERHLFEPEIVVDPQADPLESKLTKIQMDIQRKYFENN
jgi:hypothetical protein